MTELKECPYCGGTAELHTFFDFYRVSCIEENCQGYAYGGNPLTDCAWYGSIQTAIKAWNTRYEPTCKYEIDQVPEGGPVYATCTNCGWQTDTDYIPMPSGFNYCPNCGAKVIEE